MQMERAKPAACIIAGSSFRTRLTQLWKFDRVKTADIKFRFRTSINRAHGGAQQFFNYVPKRSSLLISLKGFPWNFSAQAVHTLQRMPFTLGKASPGEVQVCKEEKGDRVEQNLYKVLHKRIIHCSRQCLAPVPHSSILRTLEAVINSETHIPLLILSFDRQSTTS